MSKMLTVNFVDGSIEVIKNVKEYLCGIDFFCVVFSDSLSKDGKTAKSTCFNRDLITSIHRKYNNEERKLVLLKNRNIK